MSFAEELADAEQSHDRWETQVARLRRERDRAVGRALSLEGKLADLERTLDTVERIEGETVAPPTWLSPRKPKSHNATLALLLSDLHLDEVVDPAEVGGLNAYSRRIAEQRLERWAQNVVKLARHYLAGVTYDGVLLMLGGDLVSGDIHEELKVTNDDTILGTVLHWSEQLAAAVGLLHAEFGKVHVVAVPGNHGRLSRKPQAKLRARTNIDWLLAKTVGRSFAGNSRVTFDVPDATDVLVEVYGRGHLLTHGDQASGGAGIGGIWPPVMRLRARKAQRHMEIGRPFDTLWMGHWHQLIQSPGLVVNGSLKGWDEYAAISNFAFEQPQQAMALITPERGITFQCPVFVQDRKREGW